MVFGIEAEARPRHKASACQRGRRGAHGCDSFELGVPVNDGESDE